MDARYTAVFEKVGDWWMAYAEELPGANTQGRTREEARENLREAIQLVLEANRELAATKQLTTAVPRHSEILDQLAWKICKDLGIAKI